MVHAILDLRRDRDMDTSREVRLRMNHDRPHEMRLSTNQYSSQVQSVQHFEDGPVCIMMKHRYQPQMTQHSQDRALIEQQQDLH